MAYSKLSVLCNQVIEAGWLAAIVTTPLFFNIYSNRNIEPDKLALLQSIASIMAAAWFIKWIEQWRSPQPQSAMLLGSPLVLPTLLIVAVYLLSTFTSLVPRISFFGEYIRPQGARTMLSYVVVFAMTAQGLRTRRQLDRLIFAVILTSLPVALYAVVQKYGLDPLVWNEHQGRVGAGIGNPIFLAAYLSMSCFVTLGKFWDSVRATRKNEEAKGANRIRVVGYGLVALIQFSAFVFSNSRGPWLGWFSGLFLFGVLLTVLWRKRSLALGLLGIALVGAAFIVVLNLPTSPAAALRSFSYFNRLGSIFQDSGSGRVRTLIWEANTQLIGSRTPIQFPDGTLDSLYAIRPLVGFGPDSMRFVFAQAYPPELRALEPQDTANVRSHNETWDWVISTGIMGLLAYQFLFANIFFYGLRWLGVIRNGRDRDWFVALWVGLGSLGGITTIIVGKPNYLGLGIPLGTAAGLMIYLIFFALRSKVNEQPSVVERDCQVLLVALLAAIFSHYIEIQFGIAVAATRVSFWVFAGLLFVLGTGRLAVENNAVAPTLPVQKRRSVPAIPAPRSFPAWASHVIGYALIAVLILTTMLYDFCTYTNQSLDPLTVLWHALTFNSVQGTPSYAILGLMLVVWVAAMILALSELIHSRILILGDRRAASLLFASITLGATLAFGIGLAMRLSALARIAGQTVQDVLARSDQFAGLFTYYSTSLFLLIGLGAFALMLEPKPLMLARSTNHWSLIALVPVMVVTAVWINSFDLGAIRADIIYKLAQGYEKSNSQWEHVIALDKHAIRLAPNEDFYYTALGHAFLEKAKSADSTSVSLFSDQTRVADILGLDAQRTSRLSRNDLLFAALAMLTRSRDLNLLVSDYTVNLARFYLPGLPVNSPSKLKLAQLSDRYYTEAARLSPNDVRLWNEWADFELQYMTDLDSALIKVEKSLQLDPEFGQTYMYLGTTYAEMREFDKAIAAYLKSLTLEPDLTEAQSKLAYLYYRQGQVNESIQAYLKYIELAPGAQNLWEAHKNLALIYKESGNLPEAVREAKVAASLAPKEFASQLNDWVNQLQMQ